MGSCLSAPRNQSPQTAYKPSQQPVQQSIPEPVPQPIPEPVPQSTPEPVPQSTPEPIPQSTPEPLPQPIQHHPTQPAKKPKTFHVPSNLAAVLDFSQQSHTPESTAKQELFSRTCGRNTVALVGMGGAGKTTILKEIGHDSDIWARYPDGIWFISLGQDADVSKLMTQLEEFVRKACPQFLDDFLRMSATDKSPTMLLQNFLDHLEDQHILLIFDDVWDVSDTLYALLKEFCAAVRKLPSASLKLLTSTRDRGVARFPLHDVQIDVTPDPSDTQTAKRILCHYAKVEPSTLHSLSTERSDALESIVRTCAGLPLALSVAGTSILREKEQLAEGSKDAAWIRYWHTLQHNVQQLGETKSLEHLGLYASLQSILNTVEKKWKVETICVTKLFQSLSVLQKQSAIPLTTLQYLWGLSHKDAKHGMDLLIEANIASAATVGESTNAALAVHDLVHDYAVHLTGRDEVQMYHASLVDQFYSTSESSTSTSTTKWQKLSEEAYMSENIVYHMLGAGRSADALRLLTDYSWVQCVNKDEKLAPFRKIMSDLKMLRDYIEKHESGDNRGTVVKDIETLIETMHKCVFPMCMKNRRECSFQLYGRLASLRSDSSVIRRVMWGIEVHSARPWVRAGAGVLNSFDSKLKHLLPTQLGILRVDLGVEEDELVIAGTGAEYDGEVRVIGSNDGWERYSLDGHDTPVAGTCIDRSRGEIYSCTFGGVVKVWKKSLLRSFVVQLEENESLLSVVLLPTRRVLAVGSTSGNVRFVNATDGRVLKCVGAHSDQIWSLAVGPSENVLVSGSYDHTLRVWDVDTWTPNEEALTGHTDKVNCVVLSADERTIASGSDDESVRLWSVQDRRQVGEPLIGQNSAVRSVVFSKDANLLYSAEPFEIIMWDIESVSTGVSKIQRFCDIRMESPWSIVLSNDGSQLFVGDFKDGNVYVWDTMRVEDANSRGPEDSFVRDISAFGISCDDSLMAVFHWRSREIEVRRVEDVAEGKGDVINKFKPDRYVRRVAVCSGGGLVAYCGFPELTVFIVDISSGEIVHTFSDLEDSAERPEGRENLYLQPKVTRLFFNDEGTVLSADAYVPTEPDEERVNTSISWNVNPSTMRGRSLVENDQESANTIRNNRSRMFCTRTDSSSQYSGAIQMDHKNKTITVATLVHKPHEVSYSPTTHRLWMTKFGGLENVQLVTEDTKLEEWDEPQLPSLLNTTSTDTQLHPSDTNSRKQEKKKKGKVFISHAGPDKDTIGQVVYDKLVELGFEVFFDREELQPGQDAPRKMDEEMESASIAVVILSPEFPARKWTMRELLCFLRRFAEYGERGVIIIPVFYRLGLAECRDVETLLNITGATGRSVFEEEGYWIRQAKEGGSVRDIVEALQRLRGITGIENKNGATNGEGEEERRKRMEIIIEIVAAVVGAQKRLDDGTAAGPSTRR